MIKYSARKINILIAMAKKGFNQRILSEKSNLNPSTVSLFLNEKIDLSPRSAKKMADALDAEIEELFEVKVSQKEVISQ